MSGFMRSAAGRTAAARSRSAGMPRAGPGRGRSSPRAWRTVTGPSSSALPARAWTSAPEPGNRRPGRRPKPPPRAGWSTREYAAAYAVMKWPLAAAHTRAGIADALATITPALLTSGRGGPPATVLRAALYGHAFNPAQAGTDPGPAAAAALAWASHHCLLLTALALRLDGTRAAATTITRKRAVFRNCLGYAAELGLLAANPLDHVTWRPPRSSCLAGPRSTATPAEVQAILAEVTRIRPELTAFFGCLYYAALRPAEAVALRVGSCALPSRGWGQLTLTASLPRSARAWTGVRRRSGWVADRMSRPLAVVTILGLLSRFARAGVATVGWGCLAGEDGPP